MEGISEAAPEVVRQGFGGGRKNGLGGRLLLATNAIGVRDTVAT